MPRSSLSRLSRRVSFTQRPVRARLNWTNACRCFSF